MNNEQLTLLELIRQSQFGPSEAINFFDVNIVALYDEAIQHSVQGLVSPEIPQEYSNRMWYQAQYRRKASYLLYCTAQDELKKVLDDAGIPFVILKGNASAIYYRVPYLRSMGDIDFLVPADRYEEAQSILKSSGYVWDHNTDRHATFKKDKIVFEMHNRFSHEIAHIINGDIKRSFIDFESVSENAENKADRIARDMLIDSKDYVTFVSSKSYEKTIEIKRFAESQHVREYIVLGRLMKDKYIPWKDRTKYEWV